MAFLNDTQVGDKKYGSFVKRAGASIIDGVIINLVLQVLSPFIFPLNDISDERAAELTVLLDEAEGLEEVWSVFELLDSEMNLIAGFLIYMTISLVLIAIYYIVAHASKWQATVGQSVLGLKVVDKEGNRISYVKSTIRFISREVFSILYITYFFALFDSEKTRGLHDRIAQTEVLSTK